jgi:hypothetical protein
MQYLYVWKGQGSQSVEVEFRITSKSAAEANRALREFLERNANAPGLGCEVSRRPAQARDWTPSSGPMTLAP